MRKAASLTTLLCLGLGVASVTAAQDPHGQHAAHAEHMPAATATAAPLIKLSPDLQALLQQEMQAVQQGMQEMLPLIAAGQWPELSRIAGRIQQTFIMHQQLSPAQMEQLHQALPPEFIGLDQHFHQLAGRLAEVAEAGHPELVTFYYYKLADSCMGCHGRFATHRFPAFAPPAAEPGHRH